MSCIMWLLVLQGQIPVIALVLHESLCGMVNTTCIVCVFLGSLWDGKVSCTVNHFFGWAWIVDESTRWSVGKWVSKCACMTLVLYDYYCMFTCKTFSAYYITIVCLLAWRAVPIVRVVNLSLSRATYVPKRWMNVINDGVVPYLTS